MACSEAFLNWYQIGCNYLHFHTFWGRLFAFLKIMVDNNIRTLAV